MKRRGRTTTGGRGVGPRGFYVADLDLTAPEGIKRALARGIAALEGLQFDTRTASALATLAAVALRAYEILNVTNEVRALRALVEAQQHQPRT